MDTDEYAHKSVETCSGLKQPMPLFATMQSSNQRIHLISILFDQQTNRRLVNVTHQPKCSSKSASRPFQRKMHYSDNIAIEPKSPKPFGDISACLPAKLPHARFEVDSLSVPQNTRGPSCVSRNQTHTHRVDHSVLNKDERFQTFSRNAWNQVANLRSCTQIGCFVSRQAVRPPFVYQ